MDVHSRADRAVTAAPALALRGIHKRFGATVALNAARCTVRAGTVHALLGENGAGKTTLMRIAFGALAPDDGELLVHGRRTKFLASVDAIKAGIGMVHQHFVSIPAMTVTENVALGGRGRFDRASVAARTREVSAAAGLSIDPNAMVRDLNVGAQQRLEIVKALAHDARILILDEPTAVLGPTESQALHAWLRRFASTGGTVVLITHRLTEALDVADDVTVLRNGTTVLEGSARAMAPEEVISALVGAPGSTSERLLPETAPRDPAPAPRRDDVPRLLLDRVGYVDLAGITRLEDVSLEVNGGEIVGVIAVEGSGESELLRLLAGRLAPTRGTVRIPDIVGFIPADRKRDALIPSLSLTENFALANAGRRRGLMDWTAMRLNTRRALTEFDVRARDPAQPAAELSGGNQQRFVFARERAIAPHALVAENPGRGLDIRAAGRVRDEIRAAREAGAAIVFHSSNVDEVLAVATRVVACYAGRVREVEPPLDPGDRTPYTRALMGLA